MEITLVPVATVRSARTSLADDYWGGETARLVLADHLPAEALEGLEAFSHAEILFVFDRVDPGAVVAGARHPRGNAAWPRVGIFAQRAKARPNRIGSTVVRVVGRAGDGGRELVVEGLDAVDGTPVVDIKPVMTEFLPREPVRQPAWATELMVDYWRGAEERA